MWQGKNKAVTFSFDDGDTQDIRLVSILAKYGLKGTFNLNSGLLGLPGTLNINGKAVNHTKISHTQIKEIYHGQEIAVHTLTHPNLTTLDEQTIVRQVEEDRKALESLCGYQIVGMAYPCGGVNNDQRVADIIAQNTPIKYARTITSTHSFDLQTNLMRFNPTIHCVEKCTLDLAKRFLQEKSDSPQLFYVWGHSFEMDTDNYSWKEFESLCELLAYKDDIFYGTNADILL